MEVPLPRVESVTWDHLEPGLDGLELEVWATPRAMEFYLGYNRLDARLPWQSPDEPTWYSVHPYQRYPRDCRMTMMGRLVEVGAMPQEMAEKLGELGS